jgi:hypothetical protein
MRRTKTNTRIKANGNFWESADTNKNTFNQYFNRLTELSISMFEWKNLPPEIDVRFLELTLFGDGYTVFFYDDVLEKYLCLRCMIGGYLDVYQIPTQRTAYASNGYNMTLNENNSVLIFNNMLHTNSILDVEMFSKRLYNFDRIIDVNANAQKTPILIKCNENERLTIKNLYMKYDGNQPVIYGDKGMDTNGFTVLKTDAPYVADKIYQLKTQTWNEALTYLGISNVNYTKKERLITDEVTRNQGGTIASRYSRLESRRQACNQINKMFGLDIWCDYREDYQSISDDHDTVNGEPNTDGEGGEVE